MTPTEHGGRKIVASYVCPPIPVRGADWVAHFDGDEEAGEYGYGATKQEAVNDLISTYGENDEDK